MLVTLFADGPHELNVVELACEIIDPLLVYIVALAGNEIPAIAFVVISVRCQTAFVFDGLAAT